MAAGKIISGPLTVDNISRKFLRLDCMFRVEIRNADFKKEAIAKSIGLGGICVITNTPLPEDTELFLKFHFPDRAKAFNIKGEVIWTKEIIYGNKKGYEVGIQFLNITKNLKKSLTDSNIVNLWLHV